MNTALQGYAGRLEALAQSHGLDYYPVQFEEVPPQYATVQRTEMVAPARAYMVPVRPRCSNCGW